MAFVLLAHTDTYGDMPCKEYVQARIPEENNVSYNTQEEWRRLLEIRTHTTE